jgi:flagellar basal-body rod protein FlgB
MIEGNALSPVARGMLETPQMSALGHFLDVLSFRDQLITSNLANIDTPGYQTVDINFRQELEQAQTESRMEQDGQEVSFAPVVHPVLGLMQRPDGNNVSMERESLLLAETQLRYSTAIQLLRTEFHRLESAIHEGSTQS